MRSVSLTVVLGTASATGSSIHTDPVAPVKWFVYNNTNNIFGRCTTPTKCEDGVLYLGPTSSAKACEAKLDGCCGSFTWHHPDFGDDYASNCYGVWDGKWLGQNQNKVDR